ncbi:MAG: hypothetical protein ACI4SV_05855, partial [Duodenibacillus sp.]
MIEQKTKHDASQNRRSERNARTQYRAADSGGRRTDEGLGFVKEVLRAIFLIVPFCWSFVTV